MPSPSAARPPRSITRQLSLQGQSQAQPPAGRRGLKKQLSEDDGRNRGLDAVEVTGHGWHSPSGNGEKTEAGLRSSDASRGVKIVNGIRPRPVKLAWADRKQESTESPTGVEVVARKCQGQPRPSTVKAQRTANLPLPGDKDTLLYTRQQLAERLRVAWRERERSKPNLNIFLAHAAEAARDANDGSSTTRSAGVGVGVEVLVRDSVAFGTATDNSLISSPLRNFPSSTTEGDVMRSSEGRSLREDAIPSVDSPDFKIFPVDEIGTGFREEEERPKEKENSDSSPRSDSGFSEQSKAGKLDELDEEVTGSRLAVVTGDGEVRAQGTAQERRASFRSGGPLCKAIDESCSGGNSSDEAEEVAPRDGEIKVFLTRNEEDRPPLSRTLSAPTRNDPPKSTRSTPTSKANVVTFKALPRYTSSVDLSGLDQDLNALRGRIKSAPTRKRLKAAASRRKHQEKEDGDSSEEKAVRDVSKKKAAGARRRGGSRGNGADIVTMVSLVSPATSDAEESTIPLPEDAWTGDEKEEKGPEEDGLKKLEGGNHPPKEISSFIIQKFVSLRKTNKTVSFVQHPPINRSYSASFPSRRAPAGTPIIIPTPVITNPALTPAQLQQERERRSQATPQASVADNRGVKRRLIRAISAPQVKENEGEARGKAENHVGAGKEFERIAEEEATGEDKENDDGGEDGDSNGKEPEFKSAKEKECWKLYQKMLEKGVSVSFDTVLRGMLTPTEYRLRRNQLLSSC